MLISSSPWTYVIIAMTITGSAVFPPLPSESMLVGAFSLAAGRQLRVEFVCLATTVGAVLGDLAAYSLGRSITGTAARRRGKGGGNARGSGRREAAIGWLRRHGRSWAPGLVVGGRFIPGGTTAIGVSAGLLRYPLRWFLGFSALGAVLWTGYGAAIGFIGRAVFPGNVWASTALPVGIALVVGVIAHVVSLRRRNSYGHE